MDNLMEKIVSLCKRRAIIYPGSEIYGGLANTWDYGPYGVLLKNNVKQAWWEEMVLKRPDIVGLDSAILMNRQVWRASGHEEEFIDLLVECKKCKSRFKEEDVKGGRCPVCGTKSLTPARPFNLMLKTHLGPAEDSASLTYLRPETAQGIFVNFKNILDTTRLKLPFGVAQIGKAFRNEITPGNFTFRTREFEQMELEYFIYPKDEKKFFDFWVKEREKWYLSLGINKKNLHLREHDKKELAHYARRTIDIEYRFPFSTKGGPAIASGDGGGWSELEGVASRGDFDLRVHEKLSGKDLKYFVEDSAKLQRSGVGDPSKLQRSGDGKTKKKFWPYIIEPSGGVDRTVLAFLVDAYHEEEVRGEKRVVLRLDPRLAPIKVAVLPLVKKEPLIKVAKKIFDELKECFTAEYDEVDSIGRRYRRQDEIGTPFAVTIDFESLEDKKVTVRDRNSMKQDRVKISEVGEYLEKKLT